MNEKALNYEVSIFKYLAEKGEASIDELSDVFSLPPSNIIEKIKKLNEIGLFINSEDNKFKIPSSSDFSLIALYLKRMNTFINYNVIFYEECDGSQEIAEEIAKNGAEEGNLVLCEEIKNARGRFGRKWHAPKGGIWFSLILRPPSLEWINLISLAMGASVSIAIEDVLNIKSGLKWPNDVLINEKKICGILSEAKITDDRLDYVIVGVGLNANNELPNELKAQAISLKQIYGRNIPALPLLGRILYLFGWEYKKIIEGRVEAIISDWKLRSLTIGRKVRIENRDEIVYGTAVDIDTDGSLVVNLENGKIGKFYAGDVFHLRF
ncbi:biotin--[acetyl-CoA-carboxylase] ligase [Fervidicoccus sp.]|uniref:biotin--[acetyl-CoA-carboxylase] ligase n=1 Tax=Fervidicoccus sp. TaxID=2060324 RepID=UPI003D0E116E